MHATQRCRQYQPTYIIVATMGKGWMDGLDDDIDTNRYQSHKTLFLAAEENLDENVIKNQSIDHIEQRSEERRVGKELR